MKTLLAVLLLLAGVVSGQDLITHTTRVWVGQDSVRVIWERDKPNLVNSWAVGRFYWTIVGDSDYVIFKKWSCHWGADGKLAKEDSSCGINYPKKLYPDTLWGDLSFNPNVSRKPSWPREEWKP